MTAIVGLSGGGKSTIINFIPRLWDVALKGRTSIVIAHRLSTIMAADQILALSEGMIAQSGTHEELLKQEGIY